MIDRESRNKLAELIRSLAAGVISNDEFEDALPQSKDDAVLEIFHHGAWCLYSDMKEYKLKGKEVLSDQERSVVARWILFLKSDIEYQWPSASFRDRLLNSISLGVFGQSTLEKWQEHGELACWPFTDSVQYNKAKLGNGYLGAKTT